VFLAGALRMILTDAGLVNEIAPPSRQTPAGCGTRGS